LLSDNKQYNISLLFSIRRVVLLANTLVFPRAGMVGRKYQWIIMGTYTEQWWLNEEGIVPCTAAELVSALEGCILTDLLPLSTNGEITVSGIVSNPLLFPVFR